MRACACGLARRAACSTAGRVMSAMYCARPLTFSRISRRGTLCPTTVKDSAMRSAFGRETDRVDDLAEAGAAAEVAGHPFADVVDSGFGVALQEGVCGHQHAGRAEAALDRAGVGECLLQAR